VLFPSLTPDVFLGTTLHFPSADRRYRGRPVAAAHLAIVSIALLTWINVRGVRTAAFIQDDADGDQDRGPRRADFAGHHVREKRGAIAANFGANFWAGGGLTLAVLPVIGAGHGRLAVLDGCVEQCRLASGELKNPEKDIPSQWAPACWS